MARSPDLVRLLFSRDGHAIHSQSGASGRTAEFEVIADLGDVVEHLLEVAGDRDFLDREGKLTVLDPKATGPAGEVSGHQVHTEAEKFRTVEPVLDLADDLLRCPRTRLQKEIARAYAGISRQAT